MQSFVDIFISLLWGLFGLINFHIIYKDITKKIIPNILLVSLIFMSIPLGVLSGLEFSLSFFSLSLFLTFFISFVLYYFGVWSPGDAKYLLVLFLFIPHIGIVSFISNIIIVTIFYLCIHFLFILVAKGFFIHKEEEAFLHRILNNVWEQKLFPIVSFLKKPNLEGIMKVINSINVFLAVFVLIRLSRILVLDSVKLHSSQEFQEKYYMYIILGMIVSMIFFMIGARILWSHIRAYLSQKKGYLPLSIDMFGSNVLFIFVGIFIYYDYIREPEELIKNMRYIFSFYIIIFIAVRCVIYLYKFTFIEMEKRAIKVKDLKVGDIMYRDFLQKTFYPILDEVQGGKLQKEINIVKNIRNKVDEIEIRALKKIYKSFSKDSDIPIIDTFAFSPYIFLGFIVTIFFHDSIMRFIIEKALSLI